LLEVVSARDTAFFSASLCVVARVVIIEKMPTIGGNTIKASVGMNAAETRYQKLKGGLPPSSITYSLLEVVSARDTAFFSASLCVVAPVMGRRVRRTMTARAW
jgi:succinate dehydrogenase/fumarate reductase flavoprotein subunit